MTTAVESNENKLIEIIEDGVKMLAWSKEETFVNKVSRIVEENKQPVPAKRFKTDDPTIEKLKPPTPRFQLFSAKFHVDNIRDYQTFLLSGFIEVFNDSHILDDSVPAVNDHGVAVLFNRKLDEPLPIPNSLFIYTLTHPTTHSSIPVYNNTFPNIIFDLYAFKYDDDNVSFHVINDDPTPKDFKLPVQQYDTFCKHKINGHDGSLDLIYIILTDPVDAALEINFKTHPGYGLCGNLFSVRIIAYYDDYGLDTSTIPSGYFHPITLLQDDAFAYSGNIKLNTSFVVVPATGTLIIRVLILDKEDLNSYVDNDFKFTAKRKGSSNACITNQYCSFEVKVNWKYEENDDIHILKPKTVDPSQADHGQLQLHQVTYEAGFVEPKETEG